MTKHTVSTREDWLAARRELLEREKELTRRSDELARQRQELPWVRIDEEYLPTLRRDVRGAPSRPTASTGPWRTSMPVT